MRDFDAERAERVAAVTRQDLEFRLGGHDFVIRAAIRPEEFDLFDVGGSALDRGISTVEAMDLAVKTILRPEHRDAWDEIRARTEDDELIDMRDVKDVMLWAQERLMERPPSRPTRSSRGRAQTGMLSTVGSPSPESTPSDSTLAAS